MEIFAGTATFDIATDQTLANVVSGSGSLAKRGAGTLTLTGTNTYGGGTLIGGGTLSIGNIDALGSGDVLLDGGNLRSTVSATLENNVIWVADTDSTVSAAPGTILTLSNARFKTGNTGRTTIRFGTASDTGTVVMETDLIAYGASGLSASDVIVQGGTLRAADHFFGRLTYFSNETRVEGGAHLDLGGVDQGFINLSGIGNLTGSGTVRNEGGRTMLLGGDFAGVLEGTQNLDIAGGFSSGVILTGDNTYCGTTRIGGAWSFAGAQLQIGNGGTTGTLGTGDVVNNGALVFNRSNDLTVGNAISGSGSLTKQGAGTLTLTGANSYAGGTTVSAGTLLAQGSGALGSSDGEITVADGATLHIVTPDRIDLEGPVRLAGTGVNGAGALRIASPLALLFDAELTASSLIVLESGNLSIERLTGPGHDLTIENEGRVSVAAGINLGEGRFIKNGSGTVRFGGNNTLNGGVIVNTGILELNDRTQNGSIGDLAPVTMNGGTLDVRLNETIGSLAGTGGTVTSSMFSTVTLTHGGNNTSTTFGGEITGNLALTKVGTGTFTVTGANAYTGTTTISGGTLQIGSGGTTGTLGSGNVVNNASLVFNRSDDFTVGNIISGSGSLTKLGAGTLTLTGANAYEGLTTVSQGTLLVTNVAGLGTAAGGTTVLDGATLAFSNTARFDIQDVVTINGTGVGGLGALQGRGLDVVLANGIVLGSDSLVRVASGVMTINRVDGLGKNFTIDVAADSALFLNGNMAIGSGTFTFNGGGTAFLARTTDFTGDVFVNGGELVVNDPSTPSNQAIGDLANVTLNGGLLNVRQVEVIGSLSGDRTSLVGSPFVATLVTGGNNSSTTFAGDIFTGGLSLIKEGTGTFTLTGNNSYGGTTTINGGTLQIGNGGTTGALGTGNILNNGALVFDRSNGLTVANAISGTPTLTKRGAGTLTLSGANTYSGATTISNGTIAISNRFNIGDDSATNRLILDGGTLRTTSIVSMDRGVTVGAAGGGIATDLSLTLNGAVTFEGQLVKTGGNALSLRGENSGDGGIRLDEGRIQVHTSTALGTGTLTMAEGTILELRARNITIDNSIVVAGGAGSSISSGFGVGLPEVSGAISGGQLNAVGGGFVVLTGANTHGATRIAENTVLQIGNGGTTGTLGTGDVTAVGFLLFNRSDDFTVGNTINGTGGLFKRGGGTVTLTADNTYSGPTFIQAGTLQIGNGGTIGAIGGGEIINDAALVFNRSNDLTVGNIISGSGSLTKRGAGTLTLTGANTYAGITRIEAGSLALGASNVIGDLSALQIAGGSLALGNFTDTVASVNLSAGGITGPGTLDVTGNYTQSGGTLGAGATVNVGAGGLIRLSGGTIAGTLNGSSTAVGANIIEDGSVLVTGEVALSRSLAVGFERTGELTITGGGSVTASGLTLGTLANSVGTLTVSGPDSSLSIEGGVRFIGVGDSGTGTLNITDGGIVTAGNGAIGFLAGAVGTALVSGAGSRWETSGNFFVGASGTGTLDVLNGGVVTTNAGGIGTGAGSMGTARVSGAGSRWENARSLLLGTSGNGTLILSEGGALATDGLTITSNATGRGTLIVGAQEGAAAVAAGSLITPTITFGAGTGSIVFNHTSSDFTLASAMSGNGAIRQLAGTTTLSGNSSGFVGTTTVDGGSLLVTGALGGAIVVNSGGTLGGTGTLGAVTINAGGTLAPGLSPGTMTLAALTLNAGSTTVFELGQAGVAGGAANDLIRVTGNLALNGARSTSCAVRASRRGSTPSSSSAR